MTVEQQIRDIKKVLDDERVDKTTRLEVLERLLAKTNETVSGLRNEIKDDVSRLLQHIRDYDDNYNKSYEEVVGRVSKLETPWYRDPRFWGGVTAIPVLIISGWLVKAAFQDGAVLRLIHKGFGTEVALTEALEDDSELRSALETALTEQIFPTAKNISEALSKKMEPDFVRKASLKDDLRREIGFQFRVQHIAVLSTGIRNLSSIKFKAGGQVDLQDAFETNATTVFGALPGQKFNISIGVNTVGVDFDGVKNSIDELNLERKANILESSLKDITGAIEIGDLIEVKLDGDNEIKLEKQTDQFEHIIDGKSFIFQHFRAKGIEIPDLSGGSEFPLHTISVDVVPGNDNMIITSIIIISRA